MILCTSFGLAQQKERLNRTVAIKRAGVETQLFEPAPFLREHRSSGSKPT